MRKFLNSVVKISAVSAIACAAAVVSANPAKAEQGMQGSYVGIGGGTVGGVGYGAINGRIQLGDAPISVRPSVLYAPGSGNAAFLGTVTYDLPVAQNTNLYLGVGGAAGSKYSSFAFGGGVEGAVSDKVVLFGDVHYLTESSEAAWKVGVGYRF